MFVKKEKEGGWKEVMTEDTSNYISKRYMLQSVKSWWREEDVRLKIGRI